MAANVADLAVGGTGKNLPAVATEELDSGSFLTSWFGFHDRRMGKKEGSRLLSEARLGRNA